MKQCRFNLIHPGHSMRRDIPTEPYRAPHKRPMCRKSSWHLFLAFVPVDPLISQKEITTSPSNDCKCFQASSSPVVEWGNCPDRLRGMAARRARELEGWLEEGVVGMRSGGGESGRELLLNWKLGWMMALNFRGKMAYQKSTQMFRRPVRTKKKKMSSEKKKPHHHFLVIRAETRRVKLPHTTVVYTGVYCKVFSADRRPSSTSHAT